MIKLEIIKRRCLNFNKVRLMENRMGYLFFNHDEALLCWYYEKIHNKNGSYFLVTIDRHLDLTELNDESIECLSNFLQSEKADIFTLRKIIETKFRNTNSNFIYGAMELGVVQDVLIISPEDSDLKKDIYEDKQGIKHIIYYTNSIVNLWFPKGRGLLNNGFPENNKKIQKNIESSNLIVDIDLDYFTYYKDEKTHILSLDNFDHIFSNKGFDSIYHLFNKAKVITMALEPNYCGGIKNCSKILQLLTNRFL